MQAGSVNSNVPEDIPLGNLLSIHSPGSRERAMLHQMTAATAPLSNHPRNGRRRRGRTRGRLRRRGPDPHSALSLFPHPEAAPAPNVPGRRGEIDLRSRSASLGDGLQQAGVAVGVAADDVVVFVHCQRGEVGVRSGVGEGEGSALRCEVSHGVSAANCRNSNT